MPAFNTSVPKLRTCYMVNTKKFNKNKKNELVVNSYVPKLLKLINKK
jgi:hypothetical protein